MEQSISVLSTLSSFFSSNISGRRFSFNTWCIIDITMTFLCFCHLICLPLCFLVVLHSCLVLSAASLHRVTDPHWHPATATWYGAPEGDGSNGTSSNLISFYSTKLSLITYFPIYNTLYRNIE